MLPYFTEQFGNAASRNHAFGWEAEEAVEKAREQIADLIGATPKEIIFTSGATESNNLAIKGVAEMYAEKGNHIITAATEHKAVLDTCKRLEKDGCRVTYLPVQGDGLVDLDMLRDAITDKTILVSIMYANNEIGMIQPIARDRQDLPGARRAVPHRRRAGRRQDPGERRSTTTSTCCRITAHKMYGPKGVGALYVRRKNPRVQLTAQMDGGGHERGMRSGTLNVPGIVGLGEACAICAAARCRKRCARMRAPARQAEGQADGGARRGLHQRHHGAPAAAQPEHQLRLRRRRTLLMGINDIAVSSGSACTSATLEPSYVLKALGARRRPGAHLHPLRHRPLQHRGRGRLRRRQGDRRGATSCASCRRCTRWPKKASTEEGRVDGALSVSK